MNRIFVAAVLLLVAGTLVWAQAQPASTSSANSSPATGTRAGVSRSSAVVRPGPTGVPAATPATMMRGLPASLADHLLSVRETLHLVVWTPEAVVVNVVTTVALDGTINLPNVGALPVAGTRLADLVTTLNNIYMRQYPGSYVYVMPQGTKLPEASSAATAPVLPPQLKVDPATRTVLPNQELLDRPLAEKDQLNIRVWTGDLTHLDVTVTVSDKLAISLPPLGAVNVRGETLATLRDRLLSRFRFYYPRASVEVVLIPPPEGATTAQQPTQPTQPVTPPEEIPAWQKFPPEVTATEILQSLPRFGAAIFAPLEIPQPDRAPAGAPVTNAPIPGDYLLGPGDRLVIRCWTGAVEHYNGEQIISNENRIYLPLVGDVPLGGQTLAQATAGLAQRYGKFFHGSQTTISILSPRTVEVYVTGDATAPGKYVLPGTATTFTALYAAGGPSAIGSLRNIRLSRKGEKPRTIDLYTYLLSGEREGDEPLQPGDTIFIGPAQSSIGVAGLVRRPAAYEIKDQLTIGDAVQLAAGLDPRGYAQNIEVWRVANQSDWHVINVNLVKPQGAQKGADLKLQSGDLVLVRPVLEKPANVVEVIGAVRRPGTYEVGDSLDLATLLERAQGLEESAYTQQAAVWRLTPDHDYQMLRFNVRAALERRAPDNLKLQAGDKVYIHSRDEVTQPQEVSIAGAVAGPGVYPWAAEMRVSDLLLQARGLLPGAHTLRADVQRLTPERKQELVAVDLGRILGGDPQADVKLQPGDLLMVYTQAEVAVPSEVMVSGFVQRPGVYERREGMKVSDLIYLAGGLLPNAGEQIEYTRGRTSGKPQVAYLKLARQGEKFTIEPDAVLKDDDHVAVVGAGEFNVKPQIATVEGLVTRPGSYALQGTAKDPDTVYKLLQRAGQLLPNANPAGIVLYRQRDVQMGEAQAGDVNQVLGAFNREGAGEDPMMAAQRAQAMSGNITSQLFQVFSGSEGQAAVIIPPRSLSYNAWASAVPIEGEKLLASGGKDCDMPLMAGDVVVVPALPTTVAVLGAAVRPGAVRYQGPLTPMEYVTLAGGPAPDAMLKKLTVIRANGSALPASQVKQVQAGDVVIVPSDYMVKSLGGTSDWQRILGTLAAVATAFLLR